MLNPELGEGSILISRIPTDIPTEAGIQGLVFLCNAAKLWEG